MPIYIYMYVYIYTLEAFSFSKVSWRGVQTTTPSGTERHLLGWVSGKSTWSGILVCILMCFDAGRVEPRRTQSLYFELQLHGSWGLHNCSGVPLKLHTPKTLCGCGKSCIPRPPSLMCAVPSEEITLPQMFITTAHLCNMWQTDACTHKYATGQDNSCDSSSTNNKTEPFKSLVKSCLRTKGGANDLQQTS